MNNKNFEFAYIYNSKQGIWYIQQGLIPVDFGTGNKGDAFLKFIKNEKYDDLFSKWRCLNK